MKIMFLLQGTTSTNTTIKNIKQITESCGAQTRCIKIVEKPELENVEECSTRDRNLTETALGMSFKFQSINSRKNRIINTFKVQYLLSNTQGVPKKRGD